MSATLALNGLIENNFKIDVCNSWSDIPNPIFGESFAHELWVKKLLFNQIAGFLKVWFLEKEARQGAVFLYLFRRSQKHQVDFGISNGHDMSKNLSHLAKTQKNELKHEVNF